MIKQASVVTVSIFILSAIIVTSSPLAQGHDESSESTTAAWKETNSTSSPTTQSGRTSSPSRPANESHKDLVKEENETTTPGEMFDFTSYKNTSTFTCNGKVTGYYADVRLNCRIYHFCTQLDGLDGPSYQRMSYMCLEGSFFDQRDLNCVKESDLKVKCNKAEAEYEKSNKQFDSKEESQPSMSDNLAANIMMNPIARFITG